MTLTELYARAEAEGVTVDAFPLRSREAMSMMDEDGQCHIAIDPRQLRSGADEKTKLSHELGHCEAGAFYNRYAPLDVPARYEHRADKRAIYMLIPWDELCTQLRAGRRSVWELADWFGVTEAMMQKALRLYLTGSLSA